MSSLKPTMESPVATNTLLERKGARTVLVTTRGFAEVIEIGRQARPGPEPRGEARPAYQRAFAAQVAVNAGSR